MGRDLEGQRAEPGHESMVCRRSEVVRIVLLVS
jgi:hypothetical protein